MKKIILSLFASGVGLLLLIASLYAFAFYEAKNTTDCDGFVIDSYEVHSGINIPQAEVINCYYDKEKGVRTTVYLLQEPIQASLFVKNNTPILKGENLLQENEKPQDKLLSAEGERWGRKWTYIIEPSSNRLWAELSF
jgi:hypothetical protein